MASNPSHGGLVALTFTIVMTAIATVFMALRFWSRKMTRFGLWLDDWLAIATLVCLYAVLILSIHAVYQGGIGKPITQAVTDQPDAVTEVLKVSGNPDFRIPSIHREAQASPRSHPTTVKPTV